MICEYPAIKYKQTDDGCWLVSFSALAYEINEWSGIPQKKEFNSVESTGFQREFKKERASSLVSFYSNNANILQNPLLCAPRKIGEGNNDYVEFIPDSSESLNQDTQKGKLIISFSDFTNLNLLELLIKFQSYLEERVPELKLSVLDPTVLIKLQEQLEEDVKLEEVEDNSPELVENNRIEIESSHISDLWQEVVCRIHILKAYGSSTLPDKLLGFTKDAIISYLKPVIIVDGQHRLIGAIQHAELKFNSEESLDLIHEQKACGNSDDVAAEIVKNKLCRRLPISLILSADPAEHVFQFVVVNQKATPINSALLGTIVSTTLSNDELSRVAERLKNAEIELDASQAVSFATRNPSSPFYNLVQTGIANEQAGKLPWTVMKSIVSIFKELKGAKPFSDETKIDFADLWKRQYLEKSSIAEGETLEEKYRSWSDEKGCWRDVFISFWSCVRTKFANNNDKYSHNYWGDTRSNLFNKVSLTILATDFFGYLTDRELSIDNLEQIPEYFEAWLKNVDAGYFNRDWRLTNIKKDSPGTRKQWTKLWSNYRKDPRKLPSPNEYGKSIGN